MDGEKEVLTLETINGGAMIEQFNIALARVVDNLADINTTVKPREIHLIVKITPNEDRSFLEIIGGVKSKLAGQNNVRATADLTIDERGRPVALNRQKQQMDIPFNGNIRKLQ